MDEKKYADAMQIILHAGSAKSSALMAVDSAADGDFEAAETQLEMARSEMHEAHDAQLALIQGEASGDTVELSLILIHAQDHLSMAIIASDMAERMVGMYRRMFELEQDSRCL